MIKINLLLFAIISISLACCDAPQETNREKSTMMRSSEPVKMENPAVTEQTTFYDSSYFKCHVLKDGMHVDFLNKKLKFSDFRDFENFYAKNKESINKDKLIFFLGNKAPDSLNKKTIDFFRKFNIRKGQFIGESEE